MKNISTLDIIKGSVTFIFLIVIFHFAFSFNASFKQYENDRSDYLTSVVDGAIMEAYALNGVYPNNINFLYNYGIRIDKEEVRIEYNYTDPYVKPTFEVIYTTKE